MQKIKKFIYRYHRNGMLESLAQEKVMHDVKNVRDRLVAWARSASDGERKQLRDARDQTGAGVIHCLLLSNNDLAARLALDLVRVDCKFLHVRAASGASPCVCSCVRARALARRCSHVACVRFSLIGGRAGPAPGRARAHRRQPGRHL
eukprot:2377715-Prymnesium_polylepis.1